MKRYRLGGLILVLLILGITSWYLFYVSIWGFNIPKYELKTAIIYTGTKSYLVTKHQSVLELAKEVSSMKKLDKINPNTFGKVNPPARYRKLVLQTKDNTTYGGSLWVDETRVIQDSNGYRWRVNETLFKKMDEVIKDAKIQTKH